MSFSPRVVWISAGFLSALVAVTVAYAASTTTYTYDEVGNLTGVSGCTPTTCAAQGNSCGSISDGCGGTIRCTCGSGQICNASNVCVTGPALSVSASSLTFNGTIGSANPAALTFTATNSGGGTLTTPATSISYGSGSGWLSASVSGSAVPFTITVTPNISGLSAGTYTATISVSSTGATNSPRTVNIALQVSGSGTTGTFGADPALPGYSDQGIGVLANMVSVGQFNCPVANAQVSKISIYASNAWTGHARAVIYADSSGAPGALLGTSSELTSVAGLAWTDFTFPSPVVLGAAGNYWIGVANDATKSITIFTQSGGTNLYATISYPTLPNPWNPSNQSSSAYSKAWYATYTTSSGSPPPIPTDPAATAQSTSSIQFSWTASSGATSYIVESAPDIGGIAGVWTPIASGITQTSFVDTGLLAGTTYWYRVAATNSYGNSNYTDAVGATPQTSGGGSTGTFGADPALPSYSDQGIGVLANMVSVGRFNCPVDNAQVSKISIYASGAWTGHARAVIYADSSGAPGALLGTSNELTSVAGLVWTEFTFPSPVVLGATGNYWIGVANDATKSITIFTQSGGTNLYESISYPTIPNPWNPSNQSSSAYSKAWYATYTATGSESAPIPPKNPSASAQSSSSIRVTWTASDGATIYKIQRAPDASGSPGTWGTATAVDASPFVDSGLTANTRYWYRIAAGNSFGDSAFTSAVSATTHAVPSLSLSAASLAFSAIVGGTASPANQTVTASNSGSGTLATPTASISYGSGSGWLSASVGGTTAPYSISVTPNATTLNTGTYYATLTIASSGASGSPASVAVSLGVCGKNADHYSNGTCMCGQNAACSGNTDTCSNGTCMCGQNTACSGNTDTCSSGTCMCGQNAACGKNADHCSNGTCMCGPSGACSGSTNKCCGGACVDTYWDANNCGKCGLICPQGYICCGGCGLPINCK